MKKLITLAGTVFVLLTACGDDEGSGIPFATGDTELVDGQVIAEKLGFAATVPDPDTWSSALDTTVNGDETVLFSHQAEEGGFISVRIYEGTNVKVEDAYEDHLEEYEDTGEIIDSALNTTLENTDISTTKIVATFDENNATMRREEYIAVHAGKTMMLDFKCIDSLYEEKYESDFTSFRTSIELTE